MGIQDALLSDIRSITETRSDQPTNRIYAVLHTDTDDLPVPRVMRFSTVFDYTKSFSEVGYIDIQIIDTSYLSQLYRKRQKLELTVVVEHAEVNGSTEITETRYRATLPQKMNGTPSTTPASSGASDAQGPGSIVDISLTLYRRENEPIMAKTMTGVVGGKRDSLLTGIIGEQFKDIKIDSHPAIDNVDMVEPDNEDPVVQMIIPAFTRTVDIPTIVQESYGGIYTGGIGEFFQEYKGRKTWFIYPLLVKEEDTSYSGERVKVVVSPSMSNRSTPGSWTMEGKVLNILVTAEKAYKDNKQSSLQSQGMGFSSISAESMMSDSADVVGGALKSHSARLSSVVGDKASPDNLDYAPKLQKSPNLNTFNQASLMNEAQGGLLHAIWENSAHRHIKPSMVAEIIIGESGEPEKKFGRVVWMHATYLPTENHFKADRFYAVTEMAIYTKTMDDDYRT